MWKKSSWATRSQEMSVANPQTLSKIT